MKRTMTARGKLTLFVASLVAGLLFLSISRTWLTSDLNIAGQLASNSSYAPNIIAQNGASGSGDGKLLAGRIPSLSWIVGRDCQNGIQAYLKTVETNPDAALVGTGWLDPTTGKLINGENNNCATHTLSMDSVIQLIHQHGGKAYLTIAMETDGTSDSWTTAQQTAYVVKASQTAGYIEPIVQEVQRANYDGVIMDLEGTDASYPNIQQIFATYNQQLWHRLQPLHKFYGIALIHKTADNDEYNYLNGFENWSLLGRSADFLVVMAVDQSYWTPGPSVSVPWLQQLLSYTMRTMPQMLPHIIWELPLYGNSWHMANGQWVFDGIVAYQSAMNTIDGLNQGAIDAANSNLRDSYQPHLIYTDSDGVKQSLWFMNAQSLENVMHDFQNALRKEPGFSQGKLQFAVWWRTTDEPAGFWQKADSLY